MKNFIVTICFALTMLMSADAQYLINGSNLLVSATAGFQGDRFQTSKWRPSYNLGADYMVSRYIAFGGTGSYYTEQMGKEFSFHSYAIGARASYYYNPPIKQKIKKTFVYLGLGMIYYNFKYTDLPADRGQFYLTGHIGIRQFIGKYSRYGVNLEASFNDMSFIKAGVFGCFDTRRSAKRAAFRSKRHTEGLLKHSGSYRPSTLNIKHVGPGR